ncbi:MAG TPA: hypothetical protein VFL66_12750 [Gaiellaceae bacterium]|nr:hypothetical protein [Gaiellaceae bacterium]
MSTSVIDHASSRSGRWLQQRRFRISLWIAVAEGIVVAIFHDVSRYTVIGVAAVALAAYFLGGRNVRSSAVRQVSWIFAFSQALAVVASILAIFVFWLALVVAAIFAVVALLVLFTDR